MPNVSSLDHDILIAEYPAHALVVLNGVKDEYEKRLKINNTPHLLLVKLHGIVIFNQEAQNFVASDKEATITRAAAILCDKNAGYYEHGKLLVELFLVTHKLQFPAKLFDDESGALSWLRSQNA